MSKKYVPKYNPTRNESLDSDEARHLFENIQYHISNEQLKRDILFVAIPTGVIVLIAILKGWLL